MPTLVGHTEICLSCKKEFGSDQTHSCLRCKSYICPHCGQCSCFMSEDDITWKKGPPELPAWILQLGQKYIAKSKNYGR